MTTTTTIRPSWKVIDRGDLPKEGFTMVPFDCPGCGREDADLPVVGRVIAAPPSGGLIFDVGPRVLPRVIQCRLCRRKFGLVEQRPGVEAA